MRAITNSDHQMHSAPLLSKLNCLDIFQLVHFKIYDSSPLSTLAPDVSQCFCDK